jgi:hypothetical protein
MSEKTKIITLRASAQQNTAETVTGDGVKFQKKYREAMILLDVTDANTAAGDLLDVYIDTSPDGGTTWINLGRFTQVLGNGGAKKFIMALRADNPGATAEEDVTSDAAEGATRQYGICDRLRYRGITTEADTVDFTYSVKAFLK